MKLNKRIKLYEEFAGTAMDSSNNTAPASKTTANSVAVDKTNVKSDDATKKAEGEKVRASVIKDVDAILTNLSKLSDQIKESYMLNEDAMASLMAGIKSQFAIAKSTMMLPKYKKLLMAADPTNQKNETTLANAKITKAIEDITKSLEGKGISAEQREAAAKKKEKLSNKMAGVEQATAQKVEKAKNALSEFETKLGDAEGGMAKDSELAKAYQAKKARMKNGVREEALAQALEIAKKQGKEDAAKAKAEELKAIADKQKEIEDKIKKAEELGAEDVAELKGIQAYVKEIDAIIKSREAVKKVIDDAKTTAATISESLAILENEVSDLFSKAKGAGDEDALAKAKELATQMKAAASAELEAVAALAKAISGKEVTKSVVGLAGGDMDAAKEGEGGYTLNTFIPKYGGGSSIIGADEFSSIKAADEVLADVDAAIAKAKEDDTAPDDDTPKDDKKKLGDEDNDAKRKAFDDQITALTAKIQSAEDKLATGKDGDKEIPDSAKEGIKKNIESLKAKIEDFKTKKSEVGEAYDTVMLDMKSLEEEIDTLIDEMFTVVNESEKLPKKVKLYEGMSIADRFKALM